MAASNSGSAATSADAEPRLLLFLLACSAVVLLSASYEILIRQTGAYLPESGPWSRKWVLLASLFGVLLGAGAVRLTLLTRRALPVLWATLALAVGGSAAVLRLSFERGAFLVVAVHSICFLVALLATSIAILIARGVAQPLRQLGGLGAMVRPFRLFLWGALFATAVGAATLIGLLRSAAVHGMLIGLLGPLWHWAARYLYPSQRARSSLWSAPGYAAAAVSTAGFVLAETWVPLSEVAHYAGRIVFTKSSPRARYVLTSAQEHFSLFINGELKASQVDDYRYYEALVHPTLAAATSRARCLVIGPGDGMIARELLRYSDAATITLVVPDIALPELARRVPWLRQHARGALDSPRVTIVEAEALAWLRETSGLYDIAIVDAPDPALYGTGVHFTRYFYEQLRARLTPHGVAAIQATSATRSERTFATVLATLGAAGWSTLPYRAPVPSLGEWGFILAALEPRGPPLRLAATLTSPLRFLNDHTLVGLFDGAEPRAFDAIEPSLLYRQSAVDAFREEMRRE